MWCAAGEVGRPALLPVLALEEAASLEVGKGCGEGDEAAHVLPKPSSSAEPRG